MHAIFASAHPGNVACAHAGKGEGQDLAMAEGDDDGVLELAPHYQYISGLRSDHSAMAVGLNM